MTRLLLSLLTLLALPLAGCGPSQPEAQAPLAGAKIGGPFQLTDAKGKTVTDRDFAGRYRVMYFGYTFCPDVCPTDMQAIAAGLKRLDNSAPAKAKKIVPLFITVDPERDTPAVVGRFAAAFDPRIVGLTGTPAQIEAVKKAYAVWSAKGDTSPGGGYLVNHSRQVYLMDPSNKPLALVPADEGPEAVARSLDQWVR
ncbi:electron transporter [Sphingomonas yabuuchiae]|uniref:Electron transporter n=1 Tax=Sphingomonas yabuuchiae TaxID=172044 RepID=A0A147IPC8_9SPHN|nr:SCO family protein [Sphingomonas yabuuchiae]KTT97190.1 electron transporter [Sphingomonas yabuuchiae]